MNAAIVVPVIPVIPPHISHGASLTGMSPAVSACIVVGVLAMALIVAALVSMAVGIALDLGRLVQWSAGVALFGVVVSMGAPVVAIMCALFGWGA